MKTSEAMDAVMDVVKAVRALTLMKPHNGLDFVIVGPVGWNQLQRAMERLEEPLEGTF